MHAFRSVGSEPNPYALSALMKASETHEIVASRDIVDVRGIKLWAEGLPVSASLHQRLLDRRLQHPLETCLRVEDGVTAFTLLGDLQELLEDDTSPLAPLIQPWSRLLIAQMKQLPIHPVVQLMLTASAASRPQTLGHAVAGMALAGAMLASHDAGHADIRLAMLGGLLHDLGEIYIHPLYLDYAQPLDLVGHKHLVVHPRVGQLLLTHLTDYPRELARAVGEHHERSDRSGYPARLCEDEISPLGRALAVMELTLGVMRWPHAKLARASFALRVLPGEFDAHWASVICEAARAAQEPMPPELDDANEPSAAIPDQLADIDRRLGAARLLAIELQEQRRTAQVTDVVGHALHRFDRLRAAWNSLGLWGIADAPLTPEQQFELALAEAELSQRMRNVQRECLLLSESLGEGEKFRLSPLWRGLTSSPH
ncbi:MAG: hypothetical protein RLZZ618_4017 [Pseudomonadota bacterium]|jgi:hypothetical protein